MRILTDRRRDIMNGKLTPRIPAGYVRDGLVFFLDGKQLLSNSMWTDLISSNCFELTNCVPARNGIVLDGNSFGEHIGPVSSNWTAETIEVVFTGIDSIKTKTLLYQPMIDENVGASLRFGDNGSVRVAMGIDGIRRSVFQGNISDAGNRISMTTDRCIVNGVALTGTSAASYSANQTGRTYLGCHRFTLDGNMGGRYVGTIHAIRIYNRKLTQQEMISNQQNDLVYYGNS